jgi:hypothetical protein
MWFDVGLQHGFEATLVSPILGSIITSVAADDGFRLAGCDVPCAKNSGVTNSIFSSGETTPAGSTTPNSSILLGVVCGLTNELDVTVAPCDVVTGANTAAVGAGVIGVENVETGSSPTARGG